MWGSAAIRRAPLLYACTPAYVRRILCAMSYAVARINAALEGGYTIERRSGEGCLFSSLKDLG